MLQFVGRSYSSKHSAVLHFAVMLLSFHPKIHLAVCSQSVHPQLYIQVEGAAAKLQHQEQEWRHLSRGAEDKSAGAAGAQLECP